MKSKDQTPATPNPSTPVRTFTEEDLKAVESGTISSEQLVRSRIQSERSRRAELKESTRKEGIAALKDISKDTMEFNRDAMKGIIKSLKYPGASSDSSSDSSSDEEDAENSSKKANKNSKRKHDQGENDKDGDKKDGDKKPAAKPAPDSAPSSNKRRRVARSPGFAPAPAPAAGRFGSTAPAPSAGRFFGSAQAPAAPPFGAPTPAPAFGSAQAPAAPPFGAPAPAPAFGAAPAPAAPPFGAPAPSAGGGAAFGSAAAGSEPTEPSRNRDPTPSIRVDNQGTWESTSILLPSTRAWPEPEQLEEYFVACPEGCNWQYKFMGTQGTKSRTYQCQCNKARAQVRCYYVRKDARVRIFELFVKRGSTHKCGEPLRLANR